MKILVHVFLLMLVLGVSVNQHLVCLKANVTNENVFLECRIDAIIMNVNFYGPNGASVGTCYPPLPGEITSMDCGSDITLYPARNLTVLKLRRADDAIGTWKCEHGSGWGYYDVLDITDDLIKGLECSVRTYNVVIVLLSLLVILCLAALTYTYRHNLRIWTVRLRRFIDRQRRSRSDEENDPLLEGCKPKTCATCEKETTYAFCDCNNWFCEHCSGYHNEHSPDHHIIQTKHEFKIKKQKMKCAVCYDPVPNKVCQGCSIIYCKKCSCENVHHTHKSIVPTMTQQLEDSKRKQKRDRKVSIRNKYKTENSDINGLACLQGGIVTATDYNSHQLLVFRPDRTDKQDWKLHMEPRSLTKLENPKIAISFADNKCIRIFEIKNDGILEHIQDKIDLKDIGKPYNISYSNGWYAVEIGERKNAYVAIVRKTEDNIEIKYKIPHNSYSYGYFTGNTLRLALDVANDIFYTSAIGKQSVYCVGLDGTIRCSPVKVPSPREIHIANAGSETRIILFASNKGNAVHRLLLGNGHLPNSAHEFEVLLDEENDVKNPEHVSYDSESKLLCVSMDNGDIIVYHIPEGL